MPSKLIDNVCHLDFDAFDPDREQVIAHSNELGVARMIVPGVGADGWDHIDSLCEQYPALLPAFGIHPMFVTQHSDSDLELLDQHLSSGKLIAIGEIGLDYYIDDPDKEQQQYFFRQQLELAKKHHTPVLLHVRKAHQQVLKWLKQYQLPAAGIAHAFNGSQEEAEEYIKLGFKLSFGGMLTYDKAKKIRRVAATAPLDSIVLESDAPDMVVASHHGERNSPEYLVECAQALAELRQLPLETISETTTNNACAILKLEPQQL